MIRTSVRRCTVPWKARALLGVALAALWLWGPWTAGLGAQGLGPPITLAPFPACINLQVNNRLANSPAPGDTNFFEDPDTLLEAVWLCAGNYAVGTILPIGRAILGGLVIIMIIWTGIGFMFSGQIDFGKLLGTLFLAGFGFILLDNYFFASEVSWLPGGSPGRGIVGLFAEEAVELSSVIIGGADTDVARAFVSASRSAAETEGVVNLRIAGDPDRNYAEEIHNPWPGESIGAWVRRLRLQMRMVPIVLIKWLATIVLSLVGWMIYAQYVWGFFCLAVLTMLGPLFIPWMMIPQLDFLFWGWFKAMINGVIYMLTASALYAATAMLLVAPLERIAQAPVPDDPGSMAGVCRARLESRCGVRSARRHGVVCGTQGGRYFGDDRFRRESPGFRSGLRTYEGGVGSEIARRLEGGSGRSCGCGRGVVHRQGSTAGRRGLPGSASAHARWFADRRWWADGRHRRWRRQEIARCCRISCGFLPSESHLPPRSSPFLARLPVYRGTKQYIASCRLRPGVQDRVFPRVLAV